MDYLSTSDAAQVAYLVSKGFPPDEIEPIDINHCSFSWKEKQNIQNLLASWEYGNPLEKTFYITFRKVVADAQRRQREEFGGNRNA